MPIYFLWPTTMDKAMVFCVFLSFPKPVNQSYFTICFLSYNDPVFPPMINFERTLSLEAPLKVFFAVPFFIILMLVMQSFFYFKLRAKKYESFVPICASCKKIRSLGADPKAAASWISIEQYFRKHTITSLSHSYCPDCLQKIHSELELIPKDEHN